MRTKNQSTEQTAGIEKIRTIFRRGNAILKN